MDGPNNSQKPSRGPFHHFVGIDRLDQIASRNDRACVLNILGQESRLVTPTSHVFSGGNVAFGTSPGRAGQVLPTEIGDIPVYNDIRQGLAAGHTFNTGVVYLPPSAVRDGVAELVRVNPALTKIIIVTEKVSLHDSREIRAIAQAHQIDVFGANSLGVADSWERVRVGGALGGDDPQSALIKGSIAVFSNSGNFTSTLAAYLASSGWGTTTLISSGKDVYIHYGAPEFMYAFDRDERSKAAVLYVEPGGYYEHGLHSKKPVVACVSGRWKAGLSHAVGHAGAMAGSGDDAFAKENWFLQQFDCPAPFTPDNPVCTAKGALVLNIAHVPAALDAVMKLNGHASDFAPVGDLSLKPWFGSNQGIELPATLDLPMVKAIAPFHAQIEAIKLEIGASFIRQPMKDASGATQIDPETLITRVHGVSVLRAASSTFASNFGLALLRSRPSADAERVIDTALQSHCMPEGTVEAAIEATTSAGNSPNLAMIVAAASIGPDKVASASRATGIVLDHLLGKLALEDARLQLQDEPALYGDIRDPHAEAMLNSLKRCSDSIDFLRLARSPSLHPTSAMALALCSAYVCRDALAKRRISRDTAVAFPWHTVVAARMIGALGSVPDTHSPAGPAFHRTIAQVLAGRSVDEIFCSRIGTLLGLLVSNGPGTISAQGAKCAVSADGPEKPSRVLINKAYIGFLASCGYSHGGNGHEGIQFLLDCFGLASVHDPSQSDVDVDQLAVTVARAYRAEKESRSDRQDRRVIPGINHPVFRGRKVNIDPREQEIWDLNQRTGHTNIFHSFYRSLVEALHAEGATPNVFCVNIDGVVAAELLAAFWPWLKDGSISTTDVEKAAFAIFLVARIVGSAAEIEDHRNRGRDLDMRVPQERCRFIS